MPQMQAVKLMSQVWSASLNTHGPIMGACRMQPTQPHHRQNSVQHDHSRHAVPRVLPPMCRHAEAIGMSQRYGLISQVGSTG